MQAIGHYAHTHHPHLRVVYVSSETFTNDLISAIARKSMQEFRASTETRTSPHRRHPIRRRERIDSGGVFHTFNSLYEASKQIVITSDRSPKDIPTLEERLRSRFEWGLTADIQPPDVETRIAILKQKAQADEIAIDDETLSYIASKVESNIRELEGALNRVTAFASLHGQAITLDLAQDALKDILPSHEKRPPTIARIKRSLRSTTAPLRRIYRARKERKPSSFPVRWPCILRELTDSSLPKLATILAADHSTVIHACDKIANDLTQDPSLAGGAELIRSKHPKLWIPCGRDVDSRRSQDLWMMWNNGPIFPHLFRHDLPLPSVAAKAFSTNPQPLLLRLLLLSIYLRMMTCPHSRKTMIRRVLFHEGDLQAGRFDARSASLSGP